MKLDRSSRERRQVARMAERSAVPERPWIGRGPRYLVEPTVARACAPSLLGIAVALRDETREIDETRVSSVRAFLTSSDSPFRACDSAAALEAVVILEHGVLGRETAFPGNAEAAIAA